MIATPKAKTKLFGGLFKKKNIGTTTNSTTTDNDINN
jgi:hypothetical protein